MAAQRKKFAVSRLFILSIVGLRRHTHVRSPSSQTPPGAQSAWREKTISFDVVE